jgi:hypothetical protein
MLKDVFMSACQGLVWLDSGILLLGPGNNFLERAIAAAAAQGGVFSDKTSGDLLKWTHPGTFEYFDKHFGFRQ